MKTWIHRHGQLLGRVALATTILAVVAPVVALLVAIPFLFGGVPYPAVNPMQIALAVSGVLAIVSLGAGLTVWILRAPGYHLGMVAVLVLGAIVVTVGGILLSGLMMSASHNQVRA